MDEFRHNRCAGLDSVLLWIHEHTTEQADRDGEYLLERYQWAVVKSLEQTRLRPLDENPGAICILITTQWIRYMESDPDWCQGTPGKRHAPERVWVSITPLSAFGE